MCVCVFGINTVIWLFSYLQPQQDVLQHADGVYRRNKKLKSEEIKTKQDRRKNREVVKATERKKEDKKHRECVKCDIPQKIERTEPGRSPGRSARFVWHLTSSSLYTELLTVMQRAQFYSNKARERDRERSTEEENTKKRGGTTTFPPDKTSAER